MRDLKKLLSTGCVFLCLGGWVCDAQVKGADAASQAKDAAIDAAVAAAAAPGATNAGETPTAKPAVAASDATVPTTAPAPDGAPAAAPPSDTPSTNLNSAVVNVGVDGMVEQFNAQDLDINTALHFLSLQSKRNIIASKDVKGTVTANLYNVTFQEALDSILKPNGFDYIEKGNFIYVYTTKELEEIRKRERHTVNHIFRLHYVTAKDALALIKPMLSSDGATAVTPEALAGLTSSSMSSNASSTTGTTNGMSYSTDDTLVVNDYPDHIADIEKTLKEIDVRPKQVLIESTILNADLHDQNDLGIDIVSLSGLNFPSLLDVFGKATNGAKTISTPGQVAGDTLINGKAQANVGTDFASQVPAGGLSIGFASNNISALVRAMETVTDTTVVANPKILALNKQQGTVHVGGQFPYLSTTASQTTSTQTVNFIDTGIELVFRPFIGDDGYVRMEIQPQETDISSTVSLGAGGSAPITATTSVTSNVMVKDGRTIVIGGLFRERTEASRGQVPVLGNIPILGVPFRNTHDDSERTETIVLMTPHIINDDTALYDQSQKEAEDVRKMMLGNRAGLQPWGRDRIAQLWYSKAREQYEQGHKQTALMYVDWALNTQSNFIEAQKLREEITNKRVEEATDSSIAGFARNVLTEDASNTPDTGSSGHYPPATQPSEEK